MMKVTRNDTSVGVFLLLAIVAVATFLIAKAGTQGWLAGTKHFMIDAEDGHGIKENAPVRMNGVDVGVVEKIDLSTQNQVEVHFRVEPRFAPKIRAEDGTGRGAKATIIEPPILGLSYVQVDPGDPKNPNEAVGKKWELMTYVTPTALIDTVKRSINRVESIMQRTDDALAKANLTLASVATITASIAEGNGFVSRLITDQELANKLQDTIVHVEAMSNDMTQVTLGIKNGEGALGHLLHSDEIVVEAEKLLAKARDSLVSLDEVTKRLTDSVELVAKRLDTAGQSVEGVKQVLDNTQKITDELAKLAAGINAGKGTAGKFLTDDAIYVEARGLLKELRETVQDLREQAPINSFIGVVFAAF